MICNICLITLFELSHTFINLPNNMNKSCQKTLYFYNISFQQYFDCYQEMWWFQLYSMNFYLRERKFALLMYKKILIWKIFNLNCWRDFKFANNLFEYNWDFK